jgi:HD superfamily phosphohydrolase
MNEIQNIPELRAVDQSPNLIRIPNQIDVPVTPRIMRIVDTAPFQRLKRISQLGVVSFVYPAAGHGRFEHSLGVYRMALLFLRHLSCEPRFENLVTAGQAESLLLAALLHDIGHWPFCHPIEDMSLDGLPGHESFAEKYINSGPIRDYIESDWSTTPADVIRIISKEGTTPTEKLLASVLSGPIDIDKMDYLYRDSLHAGVPYGQNFDSARLIRSLCINEAGDRLAISHKGRTAAELMVFARYVMFSEVYWHHAVRSATSMLQRAFYLSMKEVSSQRDAPVGESFPVSPCELLDSFFKDGESDLLANWKRVAANTVSGELLDGLFGDVRSLYKRVANFSCIENEKLYRRLAQRPYWELVAMGSQLAESLSSETGVEFSSHDVLIDAPPVGLEVQFNVDVYYPKLKSYRTLGEVSPVVNTLARQQFDDYVKQVRVFVTPGKVDAARKCDVNALIDRITC